MDAAPATWPHRRCGRYPLWAERLSAYLLKAVREAKDHTSWLVADPDYEAAVQRYAASISQDARNSRKRSADSSSRCSRRPVPQLDRAEGAAALRARDPGHLLGQRGAVPALVDPDNRGVPAMAELDIVAAGVPPDGRLGSRQGRRRGCAARPAWSPSERLRRWRRLPLDRRRRSRRRAGRRVRPWVGGGRGGRHPMVEPRAGRVDDDAAPRARRLARRARRPRRNGRRRAPERGRRRGGCPRRGGAGAPSVPSRVAPAGAARDAVGLGADREPGGAGGGWGTTGLSTRRRAWDRAERARAR